MDSKTNNYASELLAKRIIAEAVSDIIDADLTPEAVTEGYNLDIRAIMKECKSKFKAAANECKKAIKKKDKEAAKAKIDEMNDILDTAIKSIKRLEADIDTKNTTISAIIGYFTSIFADMEYLCKCFLVCLIPFAGGIVGMVMAVKKLIENIKVLINDVKNYDGETKDIVKIFNMYRTNTLSILEKLKSQVKSLESKVDKL